MVVGTSSEPTTPRRYRRSSPERATAGFGYGKIVLLGEHSVVFGHPALAAGIQTGIRAEARVGVGHIRIPAWNVTARVADGSRVGTAIGLLLARLQVSDIDLLIKAEVPPGAGLGSSAAMAAAVARAVSVRTGASESDVLSAVTASETVFHTNPSGVDAQVALRGGVGRFRKNDGWHVVHPPRPLEICIGVSGKAHDTSAQVAAVERLCATDSAASSLLRALGATAQMGIRALEAGDQGLLGRLFDLAQGLLSGLGMSSPDLDAMVHSARQSGAIGAKLTGAGGGGAVIALSPSRTDEVLGRWRALGFTGFSTVVGDV